MALGQAPIRTMSTLSSKSTGGPEWERVPSGVALVPGDALCAFLVGQELGEWIGAGLSPAAVYAPGAHTIPGDSLVPMSLPDHTLALTSPPLSAPLPPPCPTLCPAIRYWVLGGRRDEHFRARWEQATDEAMEQLMVYPPGWPFSYVSDLRGTDLDTVLEHLRCFYPGSIALGVMAGGVSGAKAGRYLEFAANMTQACFQLYNSTASGGWRWGQGQGRGRGGCSWGCAGAPRQGQKERCSDLAASLAGICT